MKVFITLCLIFWVGCCGGWIIEFFFRRVVHKKWINPGFLVGPYLPLYGVGVLVLYLLCSIDYSFITNEILRDIFIILIITLSMTIIEYITGKIFIVNMKVKLWDYSDRWGNIEGIICPLFTLFWGIIGAVYYLFIHKEIQGIVNQLEGNIVLAFFVGIFWGCFVIDCVYSFNIVTKIKAYAKNNDIIIHYEKFKETIKDKAKELQEKSILFLPFKTKTNFQTFLINYKERINDLKEKINSKNNKNKDNQE